MSAETQSCDFSIRFETTDSALVVVLSGELDIAQVPRFIAQLREALAQNRHSVVLDVRELNYIDSAGLAVIASTRTNLRQEGRTVVAVGCHGIFEKILHITQLDRDVACFASLEDALEAAKLNCPHS